MSRKIDRRKIDRRKIDRKIGECPPYTFERQRGKKKDTDDYQFKSYILGQKAVSLSSGSYPRLPKNLAGHKVILNVSPTYLQ